MMGKIRGVAGNASVNASAHASRKIVVHRESG